MSNVGLSMQDSPSGDGGAPISNRPNKKRNGLAIKIVLIVVLGGLAVVGYGGYLVYERLQASAPAADYPGPGSGEVVIEVQTGDLLSAIGNTLFKADVVGSVEAFAQAATANKDAIGITPGSYLMLKKMSAAGAVERLLDPAARNENVVLIQEGLRSDQVVAQLSEATGIRERQFEQVIASPSKLPLPSWAKGTGESRAEGFLFPATYQFEKDSTAETILNAMVARFNEVALQTNFEAEAKKTEYSPYEVLIISSLVQAEGIGDDYAEIASAIYNRLDPDTDGGTFGLLQVDATLNYIFRQAKSNFTNTELASNSPYNTYKVAGLPPTPINSPGQVAIEAALDPADTSFAYWAHGAEGQSCFAETLSEHNQNLAGKCSWTN
jgi:UPF0755 protein